MKPAHPFDSQVKKGGSQGAACFRSHVVVVVVMISPVIVVIPMVVVMPVIMVVMPVIMVVMMMIPVIGESHACSGNQSRQREQNGNC